MAISEGIFLDPRNIGVHGLKSAVLLENDKSLMCFGSKAC